MFPEDTEPFGMRQNQTKASIGSLSSKNSFRKQGRSFSKMVLLCRGSITSFTARDINHPSHSGELYDYSKSKLKGSYLHTFFKDFPTLAIIGLGKTLAFRSYEYQAIALARVFAGRNAMDLPSPEDWERSWEEHIKKNATEFHEVSIEDGELLRWFTQLSNIAGLPLCGKGRVPPAFTDEALWQLKNVKRH